MEVLELEKIKDKHVALYLIEDGDMEWNSNSKTNLNSLLEVYNFQFITIDSKDEEFSEMNHDPIFDLLKKFKKPYFYLDIPEYAKGYLLEEISKHEEQIEELETEYNIMSTNKTERESIKAQNLQSWIEYLKAEVREKENHLNLKIRPQWIVKGILDLISYYEGDKLYIMHFSPKEILPEIRTKLEECNIFVVNYNITRKFIAPQQIIK